MIILDAHNSDRRGVFDVSFEGRYVVSSAHPLEDACRILMKQGVSPRRTVRLRRPDGVEEQGCIGMCAVGGSGRPV
jgi:hypothetical protein